MPKREVDYNRDNKLVVSNSYVRAIHPDRMNVNAMKLFRLVVTQCRLKDEAFFEYEFRLQDLAEAFEIRSQNLYRDVQEMCKNMVQTILYSGDGNPRHKWEYRPVFRTCYYEPETGSVTVQISDDMTELFLKLKNHFTKVPIAAVLTMKSKYAIRLFELICEKLQDNSPHDVVAFSIYLPLDEIRSVTGTNKQKTYDKISNLKNKVLLAAIGDIEENAEWKINVTDVKKGRKIVGFNLEIWSVYGYEAVERCKRTGETLPGWIRNQDKEQPTLFDFGMERD